MTHFLSFCPGLPPRIKVGVKMRSWLRDQQMLVHLKEFFRSERQLADITPPDIVPARFRCLARSAPKCCGGQAAMAEQELNLANVGARPASDMQRHAATV